MILPAGLEPRAFLGADSISYSELGSLARCEWAWNASYVGERPEQSQSAAMARGTELHRLVQHWGRTGEVLPSEDDTAAWLIGRYADHYAADFLHVDVGAVEQPFAVRLPGWDGHLFGFMDGIVMVSGLVPKEGLWIWEVKSMKDWSRLSQLPIDRQVSLYIWAARQSGLPVRGVMYDAIRTQRWVRGPERPTAESFERIWIERTDEQLADAVSELRSALTLRAGLTERQPVRNIGTNCSWCFHLSSCYGQTFEFLEDAQ